MTEDLEREPANLRASGGRQGALGSLDRTAIGLIGFLALSCGGTAAFVLRSETAAVATLVGGFALVIVASTLPRLAEVGVSTEGVTLKLTEDAAAAGAPKAASLLESTGLADYAAAYGVVNSELRGMEEFRAARVYLQDSLVRRARAVAYPGRRGALAVLARLTGAADAQHRDDARRSVNDRRLIARLGHLFSAIGERAVPGSRPGERPLDAVVTRGPRTAPAPHPHDRFPVGQRPFRRRCGGLGPGRRAGIRRPGLRGVRSGRRPRGVGL